MEQNHMPSRPTSEFDPAQRQEALQLLHKPKETLFGSPPAQNVQQLPPAYAPPPSYAQAHHDPARLEFPDAPSTELPPIQPAAVHHENEHQTLPSLSSLTGSQSQQRLPVHAESSYSQPARAAPAVNHWPSLNPFTTYYTPSHVQAAESPARMDVDVSSNSAVSAASPDRLYDGRASSVSLDDPDVRIAAEALGNLRAADVISSPPNRHTSVPMSPPMAEKPQPPQQEPLLYLLTATHPLVATTIEGAQSAYNTSKNYSPRFKSGAEYVENIVTPIANTVGSVSRVTGVEGGVRWMLGAGKNQQAAPADLERGQRRSEQRMDVDSARDAPMSQLAMVAVIEEDNARDLVLKRERRGSISTIDTLPAYDADHHSPAYTETDAQRQHAPVAPWQSRLIMSTSGLSIAMSEESLRSLKFCLRWLRWANDHISQIIMTLKSTLDQYDQSKTSNSQEEGGDDVVMGGQEDGIASAQDRNAIAARIMTLKGDVLKTLKDVIETVSKYAGGALPENARVLVRRHLTSLPQRFRLANQQDVAVASRTNGQAEQGEHSQDKEVRDGAQRVMVLAKEGLDMMAQVSGVVEGTIVSAEEWCERLGKKRRDERSDSLSSSQPAGDVKMG